MKHSWHKLSQDDASLESLSETGSGSDVRDKRTLSFQLLYAYLAYALVAITSFFLGLGLSRQLLRNECSLPGPSFMDGIDRSTHWNHSHIPVYGGSTGPIWQQDPSPEVDAAWLSLTKGFPFLITETDMRILGKDPERYVRVPQSFGYGDKEYIARFAHTHNIHCLDHIRRRLYRDYYGYPNDTMDWVHTKHCLHAVLDHLACYVEYDVFTYVWTEGEPAPDPELTYNRQCRDLDALMRWAEDNRVDKDQRVYYIQPGAGDQTFPPNPEFRALEKEMDRSNPDKPSIEEQETTYIKAYDDAIRKWQATGEVPIDERPWEDKTQWDRK